MKPFKLLINVLSTIHKRVFDHLKYSWINSLFLHLFMFISVLFGGQFIDRTCILILRSDMRLISNGYIVAGTKSFGKVSADNNSV